MLVKSHSGSQLQYRLNGYRMLEAMVSWHTVKAWQNQDIKGMVFSMVNDSHWKIKRQFCEFSMRLFEPLKDIEKLHKDKQSPFFHGQTTETA